LDSHDRSNFGRSAARLSHRADVGERYGPTVMAAVDPVLERRARIAKWVRIGLSAGYGLFGIAVVLFLIGLVVGYTTPITTVIVSALVVGSIVLAPAIVFSYAVRAADKADAEDDW
jgi:hypothetical protein